MTNIPESRQLSPAEKNSLIISKFIFHGIFLNASAPNYNNKVDYSAFSDFFQELFRESCKGLMYSFTEDGKRIWNQILDAIHQADDAEFTKRSKKIAKDFFDCHSGQGGTCQ